MPIPGLMSVQGKGSKGHSSGTASARGALTVACSGNSKISPNGAVCERGLAAAGQRCMHMCKLLSLQRL